LLREIGQITRSTLNSFPPGTNTYTLLFDRATECLDHIIGVRAADRSRFVIQNAGRVLGEYGVVVHTYTDDYGQHFDYDATIEDPWNRANVPMLEQLVDGWALALPRLDPSTLTHRVPIARFSVAKDASMGRCNTP
jgi:hypothetical protein